jgi:serine phosphatase RsbU (regulator of sigma subunit)
VSARRTFKLPAFGRRRLEPLGVAVFIVALSLTGAVALTAQSLYDHNERRLLDLRIREAGAVLSGALPAIQTPLASAATLATATNGSADRFDRFMATYVGARGPFVSASLWTVQGRDVRRVATVGERPLIAAPASRAAAFLIPASRSSSLAVNEIPSAAGNRLAYAFGETAAGRAYVAYGESALPRHGLSRIPRNAAFSDLNYALYLGGSAAPAHLLETNVTNLSLPGPLAARQVPLGDASLDLVVSPRGSLSGALFQWRARIIAVVGSVVALLAGLLAQQLVGRRRSAEELASRLDTMAEENRRLYREQRNISLTLQNSLLPRALPSLDGIDVTGRYVPALADMAIGGDWYDIIRIDGQRTLFVIGDVSGHGVDAATRMAALRYAIRAYAHDTSSPAVILAKLGRLLDVERDHQLATVLCGVIDRETDQLTLASAGHPPPLLIHENRREYVTSQHGPPVGIKGPREPIERTIAFPPGTTLLAYTDGLIERRDETLDAGLERLLGCARSDLPLATLVDSILREIAPDGADDIALLGIRSAARPARRDPPGRPPAAVLREDLIGNPAGVAQLDRRADPGRQESEE